MEQRGTSTSWAALVAEPLARDAEAWQSHGFATDARGWRRIVRLAAYGGFRATAMHRLAHWAVIRRVRGLPTILHELNHALHGIEITPSMDVGPGLYMPHTVGSVITASRIGTNVELQGGITLGLRQGDGFPVLEDGVVVSCGARVLGPITVGRRAVVGANAVVIHDVPPGNVVVGIPARPVTQTADAATSGAAEFEPAPR